MFSTYVRTIPIPQVSIETQQAIVDIIEQILKIKRDDPLANTSTIETMIDHRTYSIYNISEKEIDFTNNK